MLVKTVDIFCEVIDNYGDVGVSYRLAREMKNINPERKIRFIVNKFEEINLIKKSENIEILSFEDEKILNYTADLIIESFACNIPKKYLEKIILDEKESVIINLEYFSAEDWIEDIHLQESLMASGKARKFFFMPGISEKSGGILIDNEFINRRNRVRENKEQYLKKYGIEEKYDLIGSVFSYEKNFDKIVESLKKLDKKILLLIMSDKTQKNFIKYFDNNHKYDKISFVKLPFYPYDEYEEILSFCDFNLVRGEDSFARALLLEKPFLWHIYSQEEDTHIIKLKNFLEKYWEENNFIKQNFLMYNMNGELEENYDYFFENLDEIEKYNKNFSNYLVENCNLIKKLNYFIEKLGGNNENSTRIKSGEYN